MASLIVCPELHAAKTGGDFLARGANAVDAAIAAAFVQGVENPFACGIGGGISLYYWERASNRDHMIKAESTLGSIPFPNGWEERGDANDVGYQSVGVPGFVEGCRVAFERFGSGRFSWAELLAPSIALARGGVELSALAQRQWDYVRAGDTLRSLPPRLHTTEEARRLYYRSDGSPMEQGDTLRQVELADTLERLATSGALDFYRGKIADDIAADFAAHDGLITIDDLHDFDVEIDEPVRGTYRGLTLAAQPFSNGGHLIEALQIADHFDLTSLGHNTPAYIDTVAKIMRAASADFGRVRDADRAQFEPLERDNISPDRAASWAEQIKGGAPISTARPGAPTQGTTHLHCVDEEGNVVSHNHSIGCGGSGVITPGLGFLYNNDANDGGSWGSKRFIGAGSPLMVFDGSDPFMIAGAPGGTRIATSVIQSVLNVIDFDMDMQTAVTAPRLHSEDGQAIYLEHAFKERVAEALRSMGNDVVRNRYHARPQGILWRRDTERLEAGSDPRVGGAVGMYPPYDWASDFGGDFGHGKPPH